jgi:hypothetical protein
VDGEEQTAAGELV